MTTKTVYKKALTFSTICSLFFPLSYIPETEATTFGEPIVEGESISFLKGLSIEELLLTEITSVSKKSEQLFDAAAAITVITQEDIKRTGATTIPEALRMVPGIQVARIDSSRYAISSRGFNEFFANKLLVMIDGRSVYTPLFSGVYWNAQDTLIEDIDRIEVIRGPGATVWGANAVNGVINIITKSSADTQGGLFSTTLGNYEQPLVSARYGGTINENTTYRVWAKGFKRDNFDVLHENRAALGTNEAADEWESLKAGFRMDRNHTENDKISIQAEVYDSEAEATVEIASGAIIPHPTSPGYVIATTDNLTPATEKFNGAHILANWEHRIKDNSTIDFQFYLDHTHRDQEVAAEDRNTIDFEFRHHWTPSDNQDIVWGGGYRWTEDDITGDPYLLEPGLAITPVDFTPDSQTDELWSAFIQDDITLIDNKLWVTLGSKFEYNDYSGFEIQPSVRLRYKPEEKSTIWAAVSRAVRTPSRSDQGLNTQLAALIVPSELVPLYGGSSILYPKLTGSDNFDSEELIAYELGYRKQIKDNLSFDLTAFYNDYEKLRSDDYNLNGQLFYPDGSGLFVTPLPIDLILQNNQTGYTYGFEAQATWQPQSNLKLYASYTYLEINLEDTFPANLDSTPSEEKLSPQHQFQVRAYWDLPGNFSLDSELYYVSKLESGSNQVDEYIRFDTQLSWQATPGLKISLGVDNLFESGHQEMFNRQNIVASEIPRQYWLKAVYSF